MSYSILDNLKTFSLLPRTILRKYDNSLQINLTALSEPGSDSLTRTPIKFNVNLIKFKFPPCNILESMRTIHQLCLSFSKVIEFRVTLGGQTQRLGSKLVFGKMLAWTQSEGL